MAPLLHNVLVASNDADSVITWLQQQHAAHARTRASHRRGNSGNSDTHRRSTAHYIARDTSNKARVRAMADAALARVNTAAVMSSSSSLSSTHTSTEPQQWQQQSITLLRSPSLLCSAQAHAARRNGTDAAGAAATMTSTAAAAVAQLPLQHQPQPSPPQQVLHVPLTLTQLAARVRARQRLLLLRDTTPTQRTLALIAASSNSGALLLSSAAHDAHERDAAECAQLLCPLQSHELCIATVDDDGGADDDDDGEDGVCDADDGLHRALIARQGRLRARVLDGVTVATHILRRDGALLLVSDESHTAAATHPAALATTTTTHAAAASPPPQAPALLSRDVLRVLRGCFDDVYVGMTAERDAAFALCRGAGAAAARAYTLADRSTFPGLLPPHVRRARQWSTYANSPVLAQRRARRRYTSLRPRYTRAQLTGEALRAEAEQRAAAVARDEARADMFAGVAQEMVYSGAYAHEPTD